MGWQQDTFWKSRDGCKDERAERIDARLHRVDGLQVEGVARLDALAAPHRLHDAVAAEVAGKDGPPACTVASHEYHDVAKLPTGAASGRRGLRETSSRSAATGTRCARSSR